jgi:hypothetical protein
VVGLTADRRTDNPEQTLRLDDRDRGRILLATVITLIALPTIWLVNRAEDGPGSSRPNVAAAGLAPGEADATVAAASPAASPTGAERRFDLMGDGAVYLDTRQAASVPPPEVAIGTSPDTRIGVGKATYRRDVRWGRCLYNGVQSGRTITVVNVANGRSVDCTAEYLSGGESGMVVLPTGAFQEIADLVAAPVHVEIRD